MINIARTISNCTLLMIVGGMIFACNSHRPAVEPDLLAPQSDSAVPQLIPPSVMLKGVSYEPADRFEIGADFETPISHGVSQDGTSAVFAPDWDPTATPPKTDFAYAIYRFTLDDYDDEDTLTLEWQVPPDDHQQLWIGMSHWERDTWDWHLWSSEEPPTLADHLEFDSLAPYINDDGDIFVAVILLDTQERKLAWLRIGSNIPPYVELTANPVKGVLPLNVLLNAYASFDYEGTIVKYEWAWDGTGEGPWDEDTGTTGYVRHEYTVGGTYTAWVRVTDSQGATSTASVEVVAGGSGVEGDLNWLFRTNGSDFRFMDPKTGPDGTIYIGAGPELHAFNPDGTIKWRSEDAVWPYKRPAIAADGTIYTISKNSTIYKFYALNLDGTTKWSMPTVGLVQTYPVVAEDGTVYIGLHGLNAFNPDGTEKWALNDFSANSSTALGADGTIYLCSVNPEKRLIAINPDGTEKWSYEVDRYPNSFPVVGPDGVIYFGMWPDPSSSDGGRLHAVNPDGTRKWVYYTGQFVNTPVITPDGKILTPCKNGDIYTLNSDGTMEWFFPSQGTEVHSIPAVGEDGSTYFGDVSGVIYALNPDGTERWSYETGDLFISDAEIGSDGTIYMCTGEGHFYAFNPDGSEYWTYNSGGEIYSSPAIGADGTIYVGCNDDKLYAVNPDGTEDWSFTTGGDVTSSPAIAADGTVYVGSNDFNLYALNPDGTEQWSFATGGEVNSTPVIDADGTIYVGSMDYDFYAISPDGTEKWSLHTNGQISAGSAIAADGTIYFGNENGTFYALDPNGQEQWSVVVIWPINSTPAIDANGTIYVGCTDDNVYAFNPDGTEKWSFATGAFIYSSPAIGADGTIYIGSMDNNLYALSPDGIESWAFDIGGSAVGTPAIDADGTIYIGSSYPNMSFYALNPDGTEKWSFATKGFIQSSPAIGSDGTVFVGSRDGKLYAIGNAP